MSLSMNQLPIIDDKPAGISAMLAADGDAVAQTAKGTYCFVSLGCPKNLIDSEKMLGSLALDGYVLVSEPAGADSVIVNTCGFIEISRQESKPVIREMLELKEQGTPRGGICTPALPQRRGR